MEWISVKDKPFPKDGKNYLVLFEGQFGICAYDEETSELCIAWMPNTYDDVLHQDYDTYIDKVSYWSILEYPKGW